MEIMQLCNKSRRSPSLFVMGLLLVTACIVTSCKDDYYYDDSEPEWLGASIYDYLRSSGNFKYFVRLVDDLKYETVLSRTGSKTLFVSTDSTFEAFFKKNEWGVQRYEDLTESQKKLIMNFSMINNAYLIETLSNYYSGGTLHEDQAIRRVSASSVLDSVPFDKGWSLPYGANFDAYRQKGIHLLKDETEKPIVHILQEYLDNVGITDNDFEIMFGKKHTRGDAFIFQHKVLQRDIVCKNGYVNVIDGVMTAPVNMAEYIRKNPSTTKFAELLDRFSAPYYSSQLTLQYNQLHPDAQVDSIFYIDYFTKQTYGGVPYRPDGSRVSNDCLLPYDPGWNSYVTAGTSLQNDMAVIFAPSNEALETYFTTGSGRELKKRYGFWDNVPDDILVLLLTRHMRSSLQNSYPSVFSKMVDESSSELPVKVADIIKEQNYAAVNGLVYVTKEVYPPDDFVSVYAPVLFGDKAFVMDWAIKKYLFRLYLNSMVSKYAFLPVSDNNLWYIDPYTYSTPHPTILEFKFGSSQTLSGAYAVIHEYDKLTGTYGDSIAVINTNTTDGLSFLENRLTQLLDQSIIVGDIKDGDRYADGYYVTKNGNVIFIDNTDDMDPTNVSSHIRFYAGRDIEDDNPVTLIPDSGVYHQKNGTTFMLSRLPQTPLQSVYSVLSDSASYPEFNEFFKYCEQFGSNIFINGQTNYYCLDYNVKFFNAFRYTVYVPDNAAMQEAFANGVLVPWSVIDTISDIETRDALIEEMERIIRYHFQDESVFIHPAQPFDADLFYSATIKDNNRPSYFDTYKNKFYRLQAESDGSQITLTTERIDPSGEPFVAHTIGDRKATFRDSYINIMTRDYVLGADPKNLLSVRTAAYHKTSITTSSTAVIHLIDRVLQYE